ncbi:hypothetical protein [Coprococcus comes]|uniref:hypothetical protein n=1 Tax=Coprococcus comes TaxID=410072 RepID=UPI00189DC41A|nr:hypothetical protein [Coprococcus comes]
MKKFLKILLIIVGIVFLIFAALICIGLFVDYDDHIENGRYTYVPEDDNKDNAYVEFNLSDYDKKDSELIYYSSVEEAILNSPLNAENEEFSVPEDFLNHVDEILHIWNGKQYDTIFYRAGSDNDPVQGFVIARCKKKIENESTQYAFVNATPATTTPATTYGGDFKKFIHLSLTISDIQQDLNPNYPDTRFVFGYAHDKEIYSLEVEGQKPDGIIEYEEYGRTMYMWYYNDLKSNKRGDCLSYSVDVPE